MYFKLTIGLINFRTIVRLSYLVKISWDLYFTYVLWYNDPFQENQSQIDDAIKPSNLSFSLINKSKASWRKHIINQIRSETNSQHSQSNWDCLDNEYYLLLSSLTIKRINLYLSARILTYRRKRIWRHRCGLEFGKYVYLAGI